MNERINELWARAVDTAVPETYTSLSWAQIEKIKLVFAQLIVREYSYDVMNLTSMPEHVEMAAKHWGVEL